MPRHVMHSDDAEPAVIVGLLQPSLVPGAPHTTEHFDEPQSIALPLQDCVAMHSTVHLVASLHETRLHALDVRQRTSHAMPLGQAQSPLQSIRQTPPAQLVHCFGQDPACRNDHREARREEARAASPHESMIPRPEQTAIRLRRRERTSVARASVAGISCGRPCNIH